MDSLSRIYVFRILISDGYHIRNKTKMYVHAMYGSNNFGLLYVTKCHNDKQAMQNCDI